MQDDRRALSASTRLSVEGTISCSVSGGSGEGRGKRNRTVLLTGEQMLEQEARSKRQRRR